MTVPSDYQLPQDFDPSFASPAAWAAMYRTCLMQVIPGWAASEVAKGASWKRPKLGEWATLQNELVNDAVFNRWYQEGVGEFAKRANMGVLTGPCSGNLLVLDLDTHKHPEASAWWSGVLEVHASGLEPETVEQRTGGGGRQLFFRCPAHYHIPTRRTPIGVDIRGAGGFAVLPPSMHESGREYEWIRGPWEAHIAIAPDWLLDEIDMLVEAHGGDESRSAPAQRTASPGSDYTAFGGRQDGREQYMAQIVWAAIVDMYRECPIRPPAVEQQAAATIAYETYERGVISRLTGVEKREGLMKEGRGPGHFWAKWQAAMRHWDGRVAEASKLPKPNVQPQAATTAADFASAAGRVAVQARVDPSLLFETLNVQQILNLPDPKWLVEKLIVEQALGFIYGPPGSLKTFIGLDIALSIATRQSSWWGYNVAGAGAVVYICNEGVGSLKYRLRAWSQHRKVAIDDAPFQLIRENLNFMDPKDVIKLMATVEAVVAEVGPIAAVFVDTVSRVLPGAKENLQEDMTKFVGACDAVRQRFACTVVGVHHTNYAGGIRGSTVIPGAGAFLIETRREPGATTGSIFAKKIKDGEDGWERFFTVHKIALGDITGTTSLVLDGVDESAAKAAAKATSDWPDITTCRRILADIATQWFNQKPWCFAANSPRSAVKNISLKYRLKPKLVEEMLAKWMAEEVIAHDQCGPVKNHVSGYRKLDDI